MPRKRTQTWSYKAGAKGANRVRVYEEVAGGDLYIEWHVPLFDNEGAPVLDEKLRQRKKRERHCLAALEIDDRVSAMAKAERVAAALKGGVPTGIGDDVERPADSIPRMAVRPDGPVTLGFIIDAFLVELTPTLDPETQRNHKIWSRVFIAHFGRNLVVERIGSGGQPETDMGWLAFHAFLKARREGLIPGFPTRCEKHTVRVNVRWIKSVFKWAMWQRPKGPPLLYRNPWEGFQAPTEDNPAQEEMTEDVQATLAKAAPNWRMPLIMVLCREYRRRSKAVRLLQVSDVNLRERRIHWQGKHDKVRKSTVTPLTRRAAAAVRLALYLRRREGMGGSPWLFPSRKDASQPVSGNSIRQMMYRTRKKCGIETPRLGYHGLKRAGIRADDWQQLPIEVREAWSGTTWETQKDIYNRVSLRQLEKAAQVLESSRKLKRAA